MRLFLILLLAAPAAAQLVLQDPMAPVPKREPRPDDVTLRLGTVANQTQFHIGEPIALTLDFETKNKDSVRVFTDVWVRRLKPQGRDEFSATPKEGWRDPLGHLRWLAEGWMPGSGWPTANLDIVHPVHIEVDLNEFIVFEQPGRYVLHVASGRSIVPYRVESNDLPVEILPRDDAWTARKLAEARATLEAGASLKTTDSVTYVDKDNAQIDAVRTLRYLETEDAAIYLASILHRGRRCDQEIEIALEASPFQEAVIHYLEQHIREHDLLNDESYSHTLVELKGEVLERKLGHPLTTDDWKALEQSVRILP